jgi:cytidine deaminase
LAFAKGDMVARSQPKKAKTKRVKTTAKEAVSASSVADLCEVAPDSHHELVFGLIGPAGTDLKLVFRLLKQELQRVGYKVPKEEIRLSNLIQEFTGRSFSGLSEDQRINKLMDAGTELRDTCGRGDAVALLGLLEIERIRNAEFKGKPEKNAFVIHSLKRPEEVETLRAVYGKGFFAISVFSPREARVEALASRIGRSKPHHPGGAKAKAEELVERDELEENKPLGQKVRDVFPQADLFLDVRDRASLEANIQRFIELVFGHPFHTPTREEYGMFHARAAALRSSDMGRQVGATISTAEGDVIAVGCNDVPKAGGGLYWPGDERDARDFQRGGDTSIEHRQQIVAELMGRLNEGGLLTANCQASNPNDLADDLLFGKQKKVLKGSQLLNLLEFGRSVHAEMAALMDSARRGVSVKGAILYTTTYPCHLCAKHIVAAGIDRVIYVEPYPKSKARDFYSDSIASDPVRISDGAVVFESFVGIAPRAYSELFEMRDADARKNKYGKMIEWSANNARPKFQRHINTHLLLETWLIANDIKVMKQRWTDEQAKKQTKEKTK